MSTAKTQYVSNEEIERFRALLVNFDRHAETASGDNWRALAEQARKLAAYCNAQGAKADEKR